MRKKIGNKNNLRRFDDLKYADKAIKDVLEFTIKNQKDKIISDLKQFDNVVKEVDLPNTRGIPLILIILYFSEKHSKVYPERSI